MVQHFRLVVVVCRLLGEHHSEQLANCHGAHRTGPGPRISHPQGRGSMPAWRWMWVGFYHGHPCGAVLGRRPGGVAQRRSGERTARGRKRATPSLSGCGTEPGGKRAGVQDAHALGALNVSANPTCTPHPKSVCGLFGIHPTSCVLCIYESVCRLGRIESVITGNIKIVHFSQ